MLTTCSNITHVIGDVTGLTVSVGSTPSGDPLVRVRHDDQMSGSTLLLVIGGDPHLTAAALEALATDIRKAAR